VKASGHREGQSEGKKKDHWVTKRAHGGYDT
jgi:hypothetical protein